MAIGFLLPTCLLLFPDLISGRFFAFRDAGLYYYPLYEWIGSRWAMDGQVPLWNFQENGGLPLVSDPTSALWYPGKWIFAAPLPYHVCFQLFLSGHLVLAWWGLFSTCRLWNRSQIAASIAATSYAFGGYVLFQVANPPYLIGAAWLPWAAAWGELALRRGNRRALIGAGACLSLMMLGGDPQTAYHTLVVLALYLLWRSSWSAWLRLLTIALTMIVLSSIVILPSTTWVDRTDRAADSPRSIWDLVGAGDGVPWNLIADPKPGSHDERTYQYSYPPSRWSEYVWPNVSGDLFPTNQRWIKQREAHRRTWVPSLYMGLLPIIAALSAWALRGIDRRRRWMSRLLVLSLLAACGKFGLVAIWEAVFGETWLASGVGGLYHSMVVLFPGYGFFRYPAKWLIFSAFSVACLSSWGVDSFLDHETGRTPRHRHWSPPTLTMSVIAVSVVLLAAHCLGATKHWFENTEILTDRLYGPFDGAGAWWGVARALGHTILVGSAFLSIHLWLLPRQGNSALDFRAPLLRRVRFGWALLIISTVDLVAANHRLIPTIDGTGIAKSNARKLGFRENQRHAPERIWRENKTRFDAPHSLRTVHQQRWEEAAKSMMPKLHLSASPPIEMIGVVGSATPLDWQQLEAAAGSRDQFLSLIGVERKLIVTNGHPLRQRWPPLRAPEPRFWLAQSVSVIDVGSGPLRPETWDRIGKRQAGELVLTDSDGKNVDPPARSPSDSVESVDYRPNRLEFEVSLDAPGWLVINDRFHSGWHAQYQTEESWIDVPIRKANGWARAIHLPAGDHRVRMEFWPKDVRWGMQISGLAWLAALIYIAVTCSRISVGRALLPVQHVRWG